MGPRNHVLDGDQDRRENGQFWEKERSILNCRACAFGDAAFLLRYFDPLVITACSKLHKVLFLALSVAFLFVYEISWEPLNRFAPN